MFQQYYQGNEWLSLPLVALVFFFVFFLGVLVRVFFGMRDRRQVEELATLPFASETASHTNEDSNDV